VCCVWDRFVWVWGSECLLCVGQFYVGLGEGLWVVCGTDLCGFLGVCLLCVGQFCVGLGECGVLCVVEFCVGFGGMSV